MFGKRVVGLWALLGALALCGCSDDGTSPPASAAAGSVHAPEGVVPGSHEDWCGEHGVPESLCTRCDPSLIPAFKATGDWCDEHGLPESQCLACNPDLNIVRPPKGSTPATAAPAAAPGSGGTG